jgi:CarD family transcriptional regulator
VFRVGETVVHPGHGPGEVVGVQELSCLGRNGSYYRIRLLGEMGTVWVPVENAEQQGVRRLVRKSRLREVWRLLRDQPSDLPSDHNKRYAQLRDKIENGSVCDIAQALRDLQWKNVHVRKMTLEGKRLYDKGMRLLATEIALVRGSDTETVESKIARVLQTNLDSRASVQ